MPAGSPDGGQWTSGGRAPSLLDPLTSFLEQLPTLLLAGGFNKEDMGRSVQDYVADNCKGSIYQVLPGQFLDMTLADVLKLATSGDAAARRCKKLLSSGRFKK